MAFPLFQGLFLGFSMIIPLGAQNSHVLNQGIKRNHHILAAMVCIFCDVTLIALGIFGGAKLVGNSEVLNLMLTLGGAAFLTVYGAMSFKAAYQAKDESDSHQGKLRSWWFVLITTLAVTLLNPHVYIDTVMILGSVGSQFEESERLYFALGTMLASLLWFSILASSAAKFSFWLSKKQVKRGIDIFVGVTMWAIASSLMLKL